MDSENNFYFIEKFSKYSKLDDLGADLADVKVLRHISGSGDEIMQIFRKSGDDLIDITGEFKPSYLDGLKKIDINDLGKQFPNISINKFSSSDLNRIKNSAIGAVKDKIDDLITSGKIKSIDLDIDINAKNLDDINTRGAGDVTDVNTRGAGDVDVDADVNTKQINIDADTDLDANTKWVDEFADEPDGKKLKDLSEADTPLEKSKFKKFKENMKELLETAKKNGLDAKSWISKNKKKAFALLLAGTIAGSIIFYQIRDENNMCGDTMFGFSKANDECQTNCERRYPNAEANQCYCTETEQGETGQCKKHCSKKDKSCKVFGSDYKCDASGNCEKSCKSTSQCGKDSICVKETRKDNEGNIVKNESSYCRSKCKKGNQCGSGEICLDQSENGERDNGEIIEYKSTENVKFCVPSDDAPPRPNEGCEVNYLLFDTGLSCTAQIVILIAIIIFILIIIFLIIGKFMGGKKRSRYDF